MIHWIRKSKNYWEGLSDIGKFFIRMDAEERVTGMYTIFTNTVKFIPDPKWDGDPEIAKLFLEERYNIKKNANKLNGHETDIALNTARD